MGYAQERSWGLSRLLFFIILFFFLLGEEGPEKFMCGRQEEGQRNVFFFPLPFSFSYVLLGDNNILNYNKVFSMKGQCKCRKFVQFTFPAKPCRSGHIYHWFIQQSGSVLTNTDQTDLCLTDRLHVQGLLTLKVRRDRPLNRLHSDRNSVIMLRTKGKFWIVTPCIAAKKVPDLRSARRIAVGNKDAGCAQTGWHVM